MATPDLSGVKRLFMRRISEGSMTVDTIKKIANQAAENQLQGKATVEITSLASDGSSSAGQIVMNTNDVLVLAMDLLDVLDPIDLSAPRQIAVKTDFSRSHGIFSDNPLSNF